MKMIDALEQMVAELDATADPSPKQLQELLSASTKQLIHVSKYLEGLSAELTSSRELNSMVRVSKFVDGWQ